MTGSLDPGVSEPFLADYLSGDRPYHTALAHLLIKEELECVCRVDCRAAATEG